RILFGDRLRGALARSERQPGSVAVLFVDLDDFKLVNDRYGHAVGDEVLAEVAARLKGILRPGDTVARLGGDEFAMCCENIDAPSTADGIAARITESMRDRFVVDGVCVKVSASVGVATSSSILDACALLRNADVAMYRAKGRGRNRHEAFLP